MWGVNAQAGGVNTPPTWGKYTPMWGKHAPRAEEVSMGGGGGGGTGAEFWGCCTLQTPVCVWGGRHRTRGPLRFPPPQRGRSPTRLVLGGPKEFGVPPPPQWGWILGVGGGQCVCVCPPHAGPHNNNSDTANMAATAEPLSGERQGGSPAGARIYFGGGGGGGSHRSGSAPRRKGVPWNERLGG